MELFSKEELAEVLRKHKLWLANAPDGEWADLREADLRGANLTGADLHGANLRGADLRGANLSEANLYRADLSEANLYRANLSEANLSEANLYRANLRWADLYRADLYRANLRWADLSGADPTEANLYRANLYRAILRGADLRGADLREADLRGADLHGANLYRADLRGADLTRADLTKVKNMSCPIACPEKGGFIGFKKASGCIVELFIPTDARRCSATSRKCRCDKAKVVSITTIDGEKTDRTEIASGWDSSFIYKLGEYVTEPNFCEDRWQECAPGIHFFITREEAVNY